MTWTKSSLFLLRNHRSYGLGINCKNVSLFLIFNFFFRGGGGGGGGGLRNKRLIKTVPTPYILVEK